MSRIACLFALVATAACATTTPTSREAMIAPRAHQTESGARRITRADLRDARAETALDAVRRLRPELLRPALGRTGATPPSVSVYENGAYLGDVDVLARIPATIIFAIERVTDTHARILFGTSCHCHGGVLLVQTHP